MKRFNELSKEEEKRAVEVYKKAIVIDANNISIISSEYFQLSQESGITALFIGASRADIAGSMLRISELYSLIHENNDKVMHATTIEDIKEAKRKGKVAIVFNGRTVVIGEDLGLLTIFHKLGWRSIQIAEDRRNIFADGCGERTNCGLSDLGVDLVKEMNRLGILVDLSHAGYATAKDAIEISKKSVAFTHSNPRAMCDSRRNVPDELIKALAEKGGVIGVVPSGSFLSKTPPEELSVMELIDHIDYLAELVGIDHIAFGSDFSESMKGPHPIRARSGGPLRPYIGRKPPSISGVATVINISRGLIARGYSDKEILKILGENWLTLFEKVWK